MGTRFRIYPIQIRDLAHAKKFRGETGQKTCNMSKEEVIAKDPASSSEVAIDVHCVYSLSSLRVME